MRQMLPEHTEKGHLNQADGSGGKGEHGGDGEHLQGASLLDISASRNTVSKEEVA